MADEKAPGLPAEPVDDGRNMSKDSAPIFDSISSEKTETVDENPDNEEVEEFEFDPENTEVEVGSADDAEVSEDEVEEDDEGWGA